jgi:hypothetical protein
MIRSSLEDLKPVPDERVRVFHAPYDFDADIAAVRESAGLSSGGQT